MFNLNNSNWHADALDWIGEAIGFIGYHVGFKDEDIILKVSSYRCLIPKKVDSIDWIEYRGVHLPLGVDKSDYAYVRRRSGERNNILTSQETLELSKEIDRLNALREMDLTDDVANAIQDSIRKINMYVGTGKLAAHSVNQYCSEYYNLDGPYIKTSFESGVICVRSSCFMLDDNDKPLIVNTQKYLEAVSWFVISRLLLGGQSHPVITWKEANYQWEEVWKPRAQNEPKMPGIDELERFTNRWTSLVRGQDINHEV